MLDMNENAETQGECMTKYKDKWCQEAYNKGFKEGRDFEKGKLPRAIEIIKEMLRILPKENIEGIYEITEEAEQFLRETDIDNNIKEANEGLNPLIIDYPQQVKDDLKEGCPDVLCEDCTEEDCTVRKLGLVPTKEN